jgi:hypothetical protein
LLFFVFSFRKMNGEEEASDDAVLVLRIEHVARTASACVVVNTRTTYEQLLAESELQLSLSASQQHEQNEFSTPNSTAEVGAVSHSPASSAAHASTESISVVSMATRTADLCVVARDPAPVRSLAEFAHERGLDLVAACARF